VRTWLKAWEKENKSENAARGLKAMGDKMLLD
jgi:hypothetical protein